jgi:succinate dehydrogenase/fumarate reductase flavoprotein subunit
MRVAVLGAGMAGLTAAIAAADAGAEVTLLERAPAVGGSMALSAGGIWAPRDWDTARTLIPRGDAGLQRLLVDGLRPLWAFYEAHGIPLAPEAPVMKDDIGRVRLVLLGEMGDRQPFADALAAVAASSGVAILTGVQLESLIRVRENWTLDGRPADAVIFATGGFQNDTALLERFATPYARHLVVRSNRVSDGAALRLAEPLGAAHSGAMSCFYGHTLPHLADGELEPRHFLPASQYYSDYSVLLNEQGLRFTDESVGVVDEFNAQQGARQSNARYWLIFDERIRATHVALAGLGGLAEFEDAVSVAEGLGARVRHADSLEGLVEQLAGCGLPYENVRDSITAYNAATDPVRGLYPPRTRDHHPLAEPPFCAVECVAGITYTMGGLAIDRGCRVQHLEGKAITGLYAAGADAGGVFHDVYGGGLAWAGVTGMTAGAAAARG